MRFLIEMLKFEIQRLCYPLLNTDGAFRYENLIVIVLQPLLILLDLIVFPFIATNELYMPKIRQLTETVENNSVMEMTTLQQFRQSAKVPIILGNVVVRLMALMLPDFHRTIADNIVIDPRRRLWYPYSHYYLLVLEAENAQR